MTSCASVPSPSVGGRIRGRGHHDGRFTERTSSFSTVVVLVGINTTAFLPRNWTQCAAPRLMGLTLTLQIHLHLRSLTVDGAGGEVPDLSSQSAMEHVVSLSQQASGIFTNSHWSMCSRGVHTLCGACPTTCEGSSHPLSVRVCEEIVVVDMPRLEHARKELEIRLAFLLIWRVFIIVRRVHEW